MMCALLAASVRLNASPIAWPDRARELTHGELVMVVPVRLKLASCASVIKIVGAIGRGFEVELYVPL